MAAADPGAQQATPEQQLRNAAWRGDADAVEALVGAGVAASVNVAADAAPGGLRPLHLAALEGHTRVVELLLQGGADVSAVEALGCTALHFAAQYGRLEVARLLLDRGADVNAPTAPAISVALDSSNDDDGGGGNGVYVNGLHSCQPLHFAVASDYASVDVVELLLSRGADVGATAAWRNVAGMTPLHCTVGRRVYQPQNMLQVARALLDAGAPLAAAASDGRQALHWAVCYGPPQAAALLLERGADVNAADSAGSTPLHVACNTADRLAPEVVEVLLERGADARAADARGRQPLHCLAAIEPHDFEFESRYDMVRAKVELDEAFEDTVRALTRRGADIDAVDAEGRTPLMLAAASGNIAAGAALLQCDASVGPPQCSRCAAADDLRTGMQHAAVGMAAEAARLRQERAAWEEERAAWQQERAALEVARGGGGGGGGGVQPDCEEPAAKRARGGSG